MTAVLVAALAVGAAAVLGATFRAMYLDDRGRHRPRRATGHPHPPVMGIPRRWS